MRTRIICMNWFPLVAWLMIGLAACGGEDAGSAQHRLEGRPFYPVSTAEGLYGYIDRNGDMVIEPRYEFATHFEEDAAAAVVFIDDKMTLIGRDGEPLFSESFESLSVLVNGLAPAEADSGKSGYIGPSGNFEIPPKFDRAGEFTNGLALVWVDDRFGYIDRQGDFHIPPTYQWAGPFSEGRAVVSDGDERVYINKDGEVAFPGRYRFAGIFSEGLARVVVGDLGGYIDREGRMRIPPRYSSAGHFSEGLAAVSFKDSRGYTKGYIDPLGNLVFKHPYFLLHSPFSDGRAKVGDSVESEEGLRYGYIDKKGNLVIPLRFTHAGSFRDGLAQVSDEEHTGYIDTDGDWVWWRSRWTLGKTECPAQFPGDC